jgi:hypothetical protein
LASFLHYNKIYNTKLNLIDMKKIIAIVALATVLASCGNRANEDALAKQQAVAAIKDSIKVR